MPCPISLLNWQFSLSQALCTMMPRLIIFEFSVNKSDLVSAIAQNTGITQKDTAKIVDALIETITTTLKSGGDVTLVGFGTFKVFKRAARKGRNPKTGVEIQIKEANVPQFKPGKVLRAAVE